MFRQRLRIHRPYGCRHISLPDRIEKQICFLNEHPEIDVVGGAINEIDEEGCESGKTIVYPATPTECKKFFAKRNPLAHPAVLFRKSFFDKIGHVTALNIGKTKIRCFGTTA